MRDELIKARRMMQSMDGGWQYAVPWAVVDVALRAPVEREDPQSADDVLFLLGEAAGPGQEPTIEMAREIWALMDGETRFSIAVRAWERGQAVAALRAPVVTRRLKHPSKSTRELGPIPASGSERLRYKAERLARELDDIEGMHPDCGRTIRRLVEAWDAALRAPVAPAEITLDTLRRCDRCQSADLLFDGRGYKCVACGAYHADAVAPAEMPDGARLRKALIGLVGVSTREELEAMEAFMRVMPASDDDKVAMLNAIQALLATDGSRG